jgi:hypothetical protein
MKKLLTITILLIYFTVSTGFIISMHYCMNEFDSARIGAKADNECDKCGMETDGNCCWDDIEVKKLQVQHTVATPFVADFSTVSLTTENQDFSLPEVIELERPVYSPADSPPPNKKNIYLINCVFRL